MCAAPNSTHSTSTQCQPTPVPNRTSSSQTSKSPVPKWLKMKQQNKSSAGKQTAKPIAKQSSGSAQSKPSEGTRDEKRKRWAKKSKPVARPVAVKRGPVKSYTSVCCSLPASKPTAGQKETAKDAETGKMKDKTKGLGHWRCSGCRKVCRVSPGPAIIEGRGEENKCHQTPQPTDAPQATDTLTIEGKQ